MSAEEKIVTATTKLTEQVQEQNRTLSFLRLKLEPILNGWKENAESLLKSADAIVVALQDLVGLSTKDIEEDAKRKEDIIQKAGEIVAARIDAWIASEDGQEALLGRLSDIADAWLAEEKERLSKEREKDVAEPRSETE